jgi:hypothetical protein
MSLTGGAKTPRLYPLVPRGRKLPRKLPHVPTSNPVAKVVNSGSAAAAATVPASLSQSLSHQFGLVGLEPILEVVKTILWTGQLYGERPASAIICAPVGSGKTSVLEKITCDTAIFLSDFTSREAKDVIRNKDLTHIMIGDLLSVLNHKSGTVKLSLNILSKMTGDSVNRDPWSGETIAPRKFGVITAIPPSELHAPKLKSILWSSGFASRFIIIRYNYSSATIKRIHDYIKSNEYTRVQPFAMQIERGTFDIKVPADIAEQIRLLSGRIANDKIGARAHHHLRALVKARARMRKSMVAEKIDLDTVESICDFFTEDGRTI